MSEPTPAPDGAPATPPAASQQPAGGTPPPDDGGQGVAYYKAEAQTAFGVRDELKGANKALAAQVAAQDKTIADLQANTPKVSQAQLDRLKEIEAADADAARSKALDTGDADAIADAARKPLQEQVSQLEQGITAREAQLSTLLRDRALEDAVRTSELNPVDVAVVVDALRGRVTMQDVGGQFVPQFIGTDGQPLYNASGKVTDPKVFVNDYLAQHPGLCKAQSAPGSGAPAPGAGSTAPTQGQIPQSIAEWNAMTDEQKAEAKKHMPPGHMGNLASTKTERVGLFSR